METSPIKRKLPVICVTDEIYRTLKNEHAITGQTVSNALKFHTFSDQAKNIRKSAIEKMEDVNKQNKKYQKEIDGE